MEMIQLWCHYLDANDEVCIHYIDIYWIHHLNYSGNVLAEKAVHMAISYNDDHVEHTHECIVHMLTDVCYHQN